MQISKLCLGTAQLGMDYGINNMSGKPTQIEAEKIIDEALANGINTFDTSPEYGNSEEILGNCLNKHFHSKTILISKMPPTNWMSENNKLIDNLRNSISLTLFNLKKEQIPIYLFHRFIDIKKRNGLILNELLSIKKNGKIGKLGVSIYSPEEAEDSLDIHGIEVIQIPFNLIDKRLLTNGFLKKSKQKGLIIQARSVFLQGLFFKKEIPENLKGFTPYKQNLVDLCKKINMPIEELALRYVLSINEINSVVIGIENIKQLEENIALAKKGPLPKALINEINNLGSAPTNIINPSLWKLSNELL